MEMIMNTLTIIVVVFAAVCVILSIGLLTGVGVFSRSFHKEFQKELLRQRTENIRELVTLLAPNVETMPEGPEKREYEKLLEKARKFLKEEENDR